MEKYAIMYMIGGICNMEGGKMNKIIKKMMIIIISILVIFNIPLYSNASESKGTELLGIDDIINSGNSFLEAGNSAITITPTESGLQKISNFVSNVLLTVAIGVTVISTVIMALNFTIQSVEEKAKIKESMIPWVVGIFVSFGAYGIWKITMSVFYQLV